MNGSALDIFIPVQRIVDAGQASNYQECGSSDESGNVVGDNERNHRMRGDPDKVCPKASVESKQAFILGDLHKTINHAFVRHRSVRPFRLPL